MPMPDSLLAQLSNLRKMFSETQPEDPKFLTDYAWTIVKVLLQHTAEVDSHTARQLLADCIRLSTSRPSRLHSALLAGAVKVANAHPEFSFAAFLRMWGLQNFLPEDRERTAKDGRSFPSLVEKTARTLALSILRHPEDGGADATAACGTPVPAPAMVDPAFAAFLAQSGLVVLPMLVTRIREAVGKDGRKYRFVTLTSPDGFEVETISHTLQPSPLHPLPEGKRHYVNIGQLYNCVLRPKATAQGASAPASAVTGASPSSTQAMATGATAPAYTVAEACLSHMKATALFPQEVGYIEALDSTHAHMHVYDSHSRHFVAPVQRFSKERAGDFVRFLPIVPQASKFKSAIILATVPPSSEEVQGRLQEIRITNVNKEKGYASWELTDKSRPVTELLSPLQLSQGEASPSFTTGYINLPTVSDANPQVPGSIVSGSIASGQNPDYCPQVPGNIALGSIASGQVLRAFIYLKRGKDRQKRPHVAALF